MLTVNVGGVLVPIQAVVSQLPHGVASLARAVLAGGRLLGREVDIADRGEMADELGTAKREAEPVTVEQVGAREPVTLGRCEIDDRDLMSGF